MEKENKACTTSNKSLQKRIKVWYIRALVVSTQKTKNGNASKHNKHESKIVIYHRYFCTILATPKPQRDQLIIESSVSEGLRTGEVNTLRIEWYDFENGDMQVLDSKKHVLVTIPLDYVYGQHVQQYIAREGMKEGILFRTISKRGRKGKSETLSTRLIEEIWKKWSIISHIPLLSPRVARAKFAVDYLKQEGRTLIGLMHILRHDKVSSTQEYIENIYSYEDVKAEFNRGKKTPFASQCTRSSQCPLSVENCFCRWFQPRIEVET